MKVSLEQTYPLDTSATTAWLLLQDIKSVAACMPGAEITEKLDDTHFVGTVKVKLGPATIKFNGKIEIKDIDVDNKALHLLAKGRDTKGSSSVQMDLSARIQGTGDGSCELVGLSEVTLSGKLANFGGRLMTQVSEQILNQFATNFNTRAMALSEDAASKDAAKKVDLQPKELNALLVIWAMVISFIKKLGRKS